ncbi:MAG TPA: Ig-like domain-containing protein [Candidatus Angelobacter sp.]
MKNVVRWLNAGMENGILRGKEKAQRLFLLGAVCLVAGFASAQSVTILTPKANSTVASPVRVQATVSDSSPIVATQIYVDGIKVYQIAASGVNTTLPMGNGAHHVAVQAWDKLGRTFKGTVGITVSGGTAPAPTPAPVAGTTGWSRIEEQTGWQTCGNCGNTGHTGATASYHMSRGIGSPSLDGSSSSFSISGAPFSNGYWFVGQHPAPSKGLQYLGYEFDIYIPKGMENSPQAIEFECQQGLNGWAYNFAFQADYAGGTWRVFNYVAKRWESTGIKLTRFTPGTWHHVLAEYHNNPATHQVYHDAITIDGVRHAVTAFRVHSAKSTGSGNYFNAAFQLDLNSKGTPYHVFVDRMKVTLK